MAGDVDPLGQFLPPVARWFRATLGEPTPAQAQAWPRIAAGEHTLILAPTGSGKTLAAFLACLDQLWRQPSLAPGVRVLYVSPLKALNNDIHRNLQVPLAGVQAAAADMGLSLPTIAAGVRTGDTSTAERQRQARKPPQVLITTPESLHLLLTSRARDTLRGVRHVIVDEIHALCPNKRGVFTALLLERLAALNPAGFVRIGLSATQRPLEEVARFLGGAEPDVDGRLQPRPVAIVDGGLRKDLDLRVVMPVERFGALAERSVWPSIYRLLAEQIRQHRSTLVFANNRRAVERITSCVNTLAEEEEDQTLARAHHGSVSLEMRQEIEQALKEGRLPAVVSTASLELGIDMGAVDLVCQVESPGNIARALQRVGRAGHLVGQRSKGRLIPKMASDLLEQAVLAREMLSGRVEPLRVPLNCLDILAQQIVAMVAMDEWPIADLLTRVRQAYPFRDLAPAALDAVLEMLSGRFRLQAGPGETAPPRPGQTLAALQARLSWDRVNQRLLPLPGSQHLALVSGGTIPDSGQYAVYTGSGVRIGELDEEFIFERRVGDTFLLGTTPWRLDRIEPDRVIVLPAEAAPALVPFWRGEQAGRSLQLGRAVGQFLDECIGHLDNPDCVDWLREQCHLDAAAARNLRDYVRRQRDRTGTLPSDKRLVIEASRDQLGDWQVILFCPLGHRVNLGLSLALQHRLRQRLGYSPQMLHHDEGVLIRLTDSDEPVLDLFEGISATNVRERIVAELGDSALFALRFRHNAARALLLPRQAAGKRAPLWLQRLRGRDLLQVAKRHPDFPIVAETFRECLQDHLDLDEVQSLLRALDGGQVELRTCRLEGPSPFAQELLFAFTAGFMYQYDETDPDSARAPLLDPQMLDQLMGERPGLAIEPAAVAQVDSRLRGVGRPPRSATELAELLRRVGDLSAAELHGPMAAFLAELEGDGRVTRLSLPVTAEPTRWLLTEEADCYRQAFGLTPCEPAERAAAAEAILLRYLDTHALVGLDDVVSRYGFDADWAQRHLETWAGKGRAVRVPTTGASAATAEEPRWSAPDNWQQVQRGTLALLRSEVVTCPPWQFVDFLLRWQKVHPDTQTRGPDGFSAALDALEGLPLAHDIWEAAVLPARVADYRPAWLDDAVATGQWLWTGLGGEGPGNIAFFRRDELSEHAALGESPLPESGPSAQVLDALRSRGALFVPDLATATGLSPGRVRSALWELVRLGLATNDRFDPVRRGEMPLVHEPPPGSVRRRIRPPNIPEGRWSLVGWGHPDPASRALHSANTLLARHGVVTRELAAMDPTAPSWRVLYEVFLRLEMAGVIRRGYFVEGFAGAQFALPEAARQLAACALPSVANTPAILLHSLDPANLYGSAAPLDIPLLDGGTRPLLRRSGNWLVLRAGRPVLLIEQHGKRLTALASASADDIAVATRCLPRIGVAPGQHKLTVETWNGEPVAASAGRAALEQVGFVRDYQAMTLYAAWR